MILCHEVEGLLGVRWTEGRSVERISWCGPQEGDSVSSVSSSTLDSGLNRWVDSVVNPWDVGKRGAGTSAGGTCGFFGKG